MKCNWPDCDMVGTVLACGRYDHLAETEASPLSYYCEKHADIVANENNPEYIARCPCCGCNFGVN